MLMGIHDPADYGGLLNQSTFTTETYAVTSVAAGFDGNWRVESAVVGYGDGRYAIDGAILIFPKLGRSPQSQYGGVENVTWTGGSNESPHSAVGIAPFVNPIALALEAGLASAPVTVPHRDDSPVVNAALAGPVMAPDLSALPSIPAPYAPHGRTLRPSVHDVIDQVFDDAVADGSNSERGFSLSTV
jgi:hypothetical protein